MKSLRNALEDFAEDRLNAIVGMAHQDPEYREKREQHKALFKKAMNGEVDDVRKFAQEMDSLDTDIHTVYSYYYFMQGLIDGINLTRMFGSNFSLPNFQEKSL